MRCAELFRGVIVGHPRWRRVIYVSSWKELLALSWRPFGMRLNVFLTVTFFVEFITAGRFPATPHMCVFFRFVILANGTEE